MNEIEKILRKLDIKRRNALLLALKQIQEDYTKLANLEYLSGSDKLYRTRIGSYRIIFKILSSGEVEIIKVAKRDENTYKNL